jgi:hypothetical protein
MPGHKKKTNGKKSKMKVNGTRGATSGGTAAERGGMKKPKYGGRSR